MDMWKNSEGVYGLFGAPCYRPIVCRVFFLLVHRTQNNILPLSDGRFDSKLKSFKNKLMKKTQFLLHPPKSFCHATLLETNRHPLLKYF